jgi:hypothetical protein
MKLRSGALTGRDESSSDDELPTPLESPRILDIPEPTSGLTVSGGSEFGGVQSWAHKSANVVLGSSLKHPILRIVTLSCCMCVFVIDLAIVVILATSTTLHAVETGIVGVSENFEHGQMVILGIVLTLFAACLACLHILLLGLKTTTTAGWGAVTGTSNLYGVHNSDSGRTHIF